MPKSISLLIVCGLLSVSLKAQAVVSVTPQENISLTTLAIFFGLSNVEYPVRTYKMVYTTTGVFGDVQTVSGMISVPYGLGEVNFPIAVYNHGTAGTTESVPSREGVQERFLVNAIATEGYITIAPDYLGLGDNEGLHPYVHAASEAQAGYDMILALRDWLNQEEIAFTDQLFTTGYSQGGHASMALQQKLQEDPTDLLPPLSAGAHLSGPYSISDVMADVLFDPESVTLPGYLAYTYISYNYVYGLYDSLAQVFVEPYLDPIEDFADGTINLNQLNGILFSELGNSGEDFPDMFQDSIINILANEPEHPFNQVLRDNDTHNFAPDAPTLLVYCTEDEQVPFRNALYADSVMTMLGSTMVETLNGGPTNHGGCVTPAIRAAINFFETYSVLNNVFNVPAAATLDISPNPVRAGGLLRLSATLEKDLSYQLVDATGRAVLQGILPAGSNSLPLQGLSSGVYFLKTNGEAGRTVNKLIVH